MKKFSKTIDIVLIVLLAETVILNIIAGTFYDALGWFVALLWAILYEQADRQLEWASHCYEDVIQANYSLTELLWKNEDLQEENEELKRKIEELEAQ